MPDLMLFVEDIAQEKFLTALLERMAVERQIRLKIRVRSARGGMAKVLSQLEGFVREVRRGVAVRPDGMVVCIDANCRGFLDRRKAIEARAGDLLDLVIHAIPDPHVERWFLLDAEAFKEVLGKGCKAPDAKCEKERYKQLLNDAVCAAGVQPSFGGVEYAEDIVAAYHIQRAADGDESFGRLVQEFRSWTNRQIKAG